MIRRIALVACVVTFFLAGSGTALAEHAWSTYHWARTANPLALDLIDSVTPAWETELDTSRADWSASEVLDLRVVAGDEGARTRKRCGPAAGRARVCNAEYGQNGWLGLAQIWLDVEGHIEAGVAKMNDSYGWYWTPAEKNHVMCQEVGHVFGLGHQDESGAALGTCMDYSSDPGSQHPNAHDFDVLLEIYSHLDGYTTVAGAGGDGGGGGSPGCKGAKKGCNRGAATFDDGENWGHLVRRSEHHETYIRPRAGGGALVTHVRMAPSR